MVGSSRRPAAASVGRSGRTQDEVVTLMVERRKAGHDARPHRLTALAERLAASPMITILCAPPGFGKSTLLELAGKILAAQDPRRTVSYIGLAQHRADVRAAADAILQASAQDIVVVNGLRGSDVAAIAEALSSRFPSTDSPRIWIALHHLKQLALARFVANGTAQVIDWRNLRLNEGDLRERLDRIPSRFRKVVGDLAPSWPAACSLLCRWARDAAPDEADWEMPAVLTASGLDGYIEQEITPLLNADELDVIVHASIAETIELDVDKRGVARSHTQQALLRAHAKVPGLIERQGNRIVTQPALRHWFVARFEELPIERQIESLARAAMDFAKRGDLVVASRLYRSAGMENEIERLVVEHGSLIIWMTHGFPTVREVVDQAGDAVVAQSAVLQLMRCIVLMKTGRISEAQELFDTIYAQDHTGAPSLERDMEITRVTLLVYGCGLAKGNELERFRSIVAHTSDEPDWKSLLATLACILQAQGAQFDAAMASLIDARVHARSAVSTYNLLFLSLHEASIYLAQGGLKKARAALGEARKRWRQDFADDKGAETVMSALTASLEYELGQITSARSSVRRSAYRMPDSDAWFDIYAAAYEPMARIIAIDHGYGPAQEALADQRRKLVAHGLPRVAALLQNFAIVLAGEQWVRDGVDPIGSWQSVVPIEVAPAWQEREAFHLASAYHAMRLDRADEAEQLLRSAIRNSDKLKLARSNLRYRVVLCTLLLRERDDRADSELQLALLLGARLGARQVFLHTMSPQLAQAIERLAEQAKDPRSGLRRFVSSLGTATRTAEGSRQPFFSARETDVLKALSEGGSDKAIGRLLNMSEHGVRFHLKSIYRKFNVHDRLSAVHRAKEAGHC